MTDRAITWSLEHCPGCCYPLEGLDASPCPECGLTPGEFEHLSERYRSRVPIGITCRTCGVMWAVATVSFLFLTMASNGAPPMIGLLVVSAALSFTLLAVSASRPESPVTLRQARPTSLWVAAQQAVLLAMLCFGTVFATLGPVVLLSMLLLN